MGQLAGGRLYASLPEEASPLGDRTNFTYGVPRSVASFDRAPPQQQQGSHYAAAAAKARQAAPAAAARGARGDETPDFAENAGSEAGGALSHRDHAPALSAAKAEWLQSIQAAGTSALPPRPAMHEQGGVTAPLSESALLASQRSRSGRLYSGDSLGARRSGRLTAAEVLRSRRAPMEKAGLPFPALAPGGKGSGAVAASEIVRRAEEEVKKSAINDDDLSDSETESSRSRSGG